MKLKCIIVDDDVHAINGLKAYVDMMPQLELIHIYTDPLEVLSDLTDSKSVDIIFMDVDMPFINGIELSKVIRNRTDKLIFTTSHAKYALDAFEIHASDFLLKPYTLARFAETINRLFPKKDLNMTKQQASTEDYFFVRDKNDNKNLVRIRYADIVIVESLQNYVRIHTLTKPVVTYITLGEMKLLLKQESDFLQIHRSFIISHNYILKIEGNTMFMVNGIELTIGKFYREQVMDFVKARTIKTNRT